METMEKQKKQTPRKKKPNLSTQNRLKKSRKNTDKGQQQQKPALSTGENQQRIKLILISMLLAAMVLLLVFAGMRYRILEVSDSSMEPTLYSSQKVLVDQRESIKRYDLVAATINKQESSRQYIQRVIGLPGDSIWVEGSTVFINNNLKQDVSLSPQIYANQLPAGTYSFVVEDAAVLSELQRVQNIPAERYLLLNDNFEKVTDSRRFGFVKENWISGVVDYRVWPLNQGGQL